MRVKFANGVVKECTAPTEQKVFKTIGEETVGGGWLLALRIEGNITSAALDSLLAEENIRTLEFSTVDENGEEKTLFSLEGYDKITASMIRHAEDADSPYAEIQMSKGL